MEIEIVRTHDEWECGDGCCYEWAEGADVFVDGKMVLCLEPEARGGHYDDAAVYAAILEYLGHAVKWRSG